MDRRSLTLLLDSAEPALGASPPYLGAWVRRHAGPRLAELESLYSERNGFLAFDRALRVFPAIPPAHALSINRWNGLRIWRDSYGRLANDLLFFADDIFGVQFCIQSGKIFTFDPETAALEQIAEDLAGWLAVILSETDYRTGRPFALDWQTANGLIEPTQRLVPKQLFMLGGDYVLTNFYVLDAVEAMRFRGDVAQQTQHLPDGAKVRFVVTE